MAKFIARADAATGQQAANDPAPKAITARYASPELAAGVGSRACRRCVCARVHRLRDPLAASIPLDAMPILAFAVSNFD